MPLQLLINPRVRGAFFNQAHLVCLAELESIYPELEARFHHFGPLEFVEVAREIELAPQLTRLSWVQAIFQGTPPTLECLELVPQFEQPEALVWGSKYRGKTNELVTQLAINLAVRHAEVGHRSLPSLIDPMAGRGTTLLWAARYGVDAVGIEVDPQALQHFERDVKRQTKLHKIKHKTEHGGPKKSKRGAAGRFFEFRWSKSSSKLMIGDTREATKLCSGRRFHYLVSDLPYGIQFSGRESRGPLSLLTEAAPEWANLLYEGGVMVLIFNTLLSSRDDLVELFTPAGFEVLPFTAPHRMSESIERDLLVMRRQSSK